MTERLRRSFLYTPADRPEMLERAADTAADALVFDLEDAVRPSDRPTAREHLATALETVDYGDTEVCVRINAIGTDDWLDDLTAAVAAGVDTISVPMVERPEQVEAVVEAAAQRADDRPEIILLLETPTGVFDGREIVRTARELPAVTGLSFGVGDYARAVGGTPTSDEIRRFLNHRVVGLAAIGGLQPISSVYPSAGDLDVVRSVAEAARDVGFVGQSVIHPDQVPAVNEVFTLSAEEAQRAVGLVERYEASDLGAVVVDGEFLDEPLVDRYRRQLRRYEAVHGAPP